MNYILCITFPLGLITVINAISDWKPIIGTGPALKSIQQPILLNGAVRTSSSSKSSFTFNGQTITTSIGDAAANEAITGPVLSVDAPDLTPDIDTEPKYYGYGEGKILNGLFTASPAVVSQTFHAKGNCKKKSKLSNYLIEEW